MSITLDIIGTINKINAHDIISLQCWINIIFNLNVTCDSYSASDV